MTVAMRDQRQAGAVQIVVGAGLNGLMIADLLRDRGPVVVLEASPHIGGLLRSFDFGEHGRFDCGTHIFAETGEASLDDYLAGLLPAERWNWLRGHRRNFAGLVFNDRIQLYTMYPDITSLDDDVYASCMATLPRVDEGSADATTAADYFRVRYGPVIAERVCAPIVEGFANHPVGQLHPMVTRLCPLDRLAMFDEAGARAHVDDPDLGRRLAFVDQRDLPASQQSTLASFYPDTRGIGQAVEALAARITAAGVTLRTATSILHAKSTGQGIELSLADGSTLLGSHVYWTASPLALATVAGSAIDYTSMDRPLTTALCHLVLDAAPRFEDVHYLQVADPAHHTYRYTNYDAFCPEGHPSGTPVTVELLYDGAVDEPTVLATALDEMQAIGLSDGRIAVQFSSVHLLPYGFPRPTLANVDALATARGRVRDRLGDAVSMLGIGSGDGLFFMTDVLKASFARMREMGAETAGRP